MQEKNNLDLGEMTSRDIGNKISKRLVEIGENAIQSAGPDGYINFGNPTDTTGPNGFVDFGDLPSRALPELGKKVVENKIENIL